MPVNELILLLSDVARLLHSESCWLYQMFQIRQCHNELSGVCLFVCVTVIYIMLQTVHIMPCSCANEHTIGHEYSICNNEAWDFHCVSNYLHKLGQSVRFEEDDSGQRTSHPGNENPEEENECSENSGSTNRNSSLSVDSKVDASEVVNDNSKRNLDNWQYAEHMEPKILLQVWQYMIHI